VVTVCQPSRKSLIGFVPTYRIDNHIHFVLVSFVLFFPQYLQLYHYNAHIHFVLLSKIGGMYANQVNYGKAVRELIILSHKIF
jgi:hypothetical protein